MITIPNLHSASCGTPPVIDPQEARWLSYFENPDREQFLFVVTKDRKALLYSGDNGWGRAIEVEVRPISAVLGFCSVSGAGSARILVQPATGQPLMGLGREAGWICACWDSSEWARTGKA